MRGRPSPKKALPHTPTQELYTLKKAARKGLPFSMYRGLERVVGKTSPQEVFPTRPLINNNLPSIDCTLFAANGEEDYENGDDGNDDAADDI